MSPDLSLKKKNTPAVRLLQATTNSSQFVWSLIGGSTIKTNYNVAHTNLLNCEKAFLVALTTEQDLEN